MISNKRMKMKRLISAGVLTVTSIAMLMPALTVMAGDINPAENTIVLASKQTYEKAGHYWKAKPDYISRGISYLKRDDIDLTDAEAASYLSSFYDAVGDPEYFDDLGEVPKSDVPVVPDEPVVSEEPTEEISEEVTEKVSEEASVEVSEIETESVEETDSEEVSEEISEETQIIKLDNDEVIKAQLEMEEALKPSREYQDQEKPKKNIPLGLIAGGIAGGALIIGAVVILIHKYKSANGK